MSLDHNHLALLALFLRPRHLDIPAWQGIWADALGESYGDAIEGFIKRGLLAAADPSFEERISLLRVADIKPVLKRHGIKTSGKREDIVARLLQELPHEAQSLADGMSFEGQYACTTAGSALAAINKQSVDAKRLATEEEVRLALRQGDLQRACHLVDAFRSSQPSPMVGGGALSADALWAQAILAIEAVPQMTAEEADEAKLAAAEDAIWGRRPGGPKHFLPAVYTAMFTASNARQLDELRRSSVVKGVQILASPDACDSCKQLAAEGPYPLDKVPQVPNPKCAHPKGWCRCNYVAETMSWAELGIHVSGLEGF